MCIKDVHVPDRVRPHRWFPVRVTIKNVQNDVDAVRVTGAGKGLRAVPTMTGPLRSGESLTARLWVRLRVDAARQLHIATLPFVGGLPTRDHQVVTIDPR